MSNSAQSVFVTELMCLQWSVDIGNVPPEVDAVARKVFSVYFSIQAELTDLLGRYLYEKPVPKLEA